MVSINMLHVDCERVHTVGHGMDSPEQLSKVGCCRVVNEGSHEIQGNGESKNDMRQPMDVYVDSSQLHK